MKLTPRSPMLSCRCPTMLERAIEQRVREQAAHWYPEYVQVPSVTLEQLSSRPRSQLYLVTVGEGHDTRKILAKVRRGDDGAGGAPGDGGRPTLATDRLDSAELTRLEYEGLRSIFDVFSSMDSRFSAIRPLDHMPDWNTILMEYVQAPTLRRVLVNRSRVSPHQRSARRQDATIVWRRVGEWLQAFHTAMPRRSLPTRQETRSDVVGQFRAYGAFLADRLGSSDVRDLAERATDLAHDVLPAQLRMAVGHGDFAPRNVFLHATGSLTVFDPMARWVVPTHEDLSRFLVGMRLSGLQVHSRGLAYPRHELERRELSVIGGYYLGAVPPLAQLRCYQLLIMMDKWSALVHASDRQRGGGLRARSLRGATGYLRGEAQRILNRAESVTGEEHPDS